MCVCLCVCVALRSSACFAWAMNAPNGKKATLRVLRGCQSTLWLLSNQLNQQSTHTEKTHTTQHTENITINIKKTKEKLIKKEKQIYILVQIYILL